MANNHPSAGEAITQVISTLQQIDITRPDTNTVPNGRGGHAKYTE